MTKKTINNTLPNGTILRGIYRIDRFLSSGGFGNTYAATNIEFDEQVAVKEFFLKGKTERDGDTSSVTVSNPENQQEFFLQLDKFKKEARRIRRLQNDHIIKVHDLFEENGTAYYVMDYIDGESLSDRMKRTDKPMTENEVLEILPQILEGLKSVHDISVWHMDLKPSNIMMDKNGKVTIIDFGASKHIEQGKSLTTSMAVGKTVAYCPPEQTQETLKNVGPWTDIYSLGATLYSLLTRKTPPTFDDILDEGNEAFYFPASVSDNLQKLIIWMMKPNRKERPQSIEEVKAFLASGEGPSDNEENEETILEQENETSEETILDSGKETVLEEKEQVNVSETVAYIFMILAGLILACCIGYGIFSANVNHKRKEDSNIENTAVTSGTTRVYYDWGSGIYTGDLKDEEPHGHGTINYDDGKKFVGEFMNGQAHGHGVYYRADGSVLFDGTYKSGQRVDGTVTYDNGSKYTGTFSYDGSPHGQGIYRDKNGDVLFKGEYSYGYRENGYGKEESDYYTFEGEYKNGRWNGTGTIIWKNVKNGHSTKFVGTFVNGVKTKGLMYFKGGDMYEGTFKDDSWKNGTGTYYWSYDHTYQTGTWKNGELINQTDEGTWEQ